MTYRNKRILFIGTGFFDYEDSILQELRNRGAIVYYFSTVLTTFHTKLLIRIGHAEKCADVLSNQILKMISSQPDDIDLIFIIKAENFLRCHIELLKEKYPNTPKILYLWDSLNRLPNKNLLLNSFANIQTFDRRDANEYNLKFRPLFCRIIDEVKTPAKFDLSFVGSDHTIRYSLLKKLSHQLDKADLSYKFVLRIGRLSYVIKRYYSHQISNHTKKWFITNPLKYSEYINISKQSNVILDIANPMQSGLTIRSVEAMGLGKKILTTNNDIENYNINKNNYCIIDPENPKLEIDFLKDYCKIRYTLDTYRLEQFIDDIFDNWI